MTSSLFQIFADQAAALGMPFTATDTARTRFEALAHRQTADADLTLIEQSGIANRLCFLISGKARFFRQRRSEGVFLASVTTPLTPLGISGLTSPGRYMSEIRLSEGSDYITLDLAKLRDLHHVDPTFGSHLQALIWAQATSLLWATRGLQGPPPAEDLAISDGALHASDYDVANRIGDAAFFAPLSNQRLKDLLEYADLQLFGAGSVIDIEGVPSTGVKFLFSGRVLAHFTEARDGKPHQRTRTVVRPGVALCWHNGFCDLPSPYTVIASRDTSMLSISAANLRRMVEEDPHLASALLQQQIWQIGRYQQTAAGLSQGAVEDEAAHMQALLQDNSARIPVESLLHGVPHALRNRFTRGYALDCVYDAVIGGNEAERSVAGLMMDALEGVEQEHRFFRHLNAVYARVASAARDANPVRLRELANDDFASAFEQVAYVIQGMELLPDSPRNIFFYNHLAACPDNELANGHAFSVDSHFISSKILLPKYGDGGQRIVRTSRNTEFWRNGYYSRLDNIFVHNAESDWLEETPQEKELRKEMLFIEAQKTFDAGRPLSIAPEGTSETPDNLTPTSPGPFKPGAFLLADRLKPSPLLVPIALANFDYPVSRTVYAAVIKPPFHLSDHVKDVNDREEVQDFLDRYREVFRGYVLEARQLAERVQTNANDLPAGVVSNVGLVSPIEQEFESDVRELEARVLQHRRRGRVALYGSSTFRLWADAARDLGTDDLINLGFGGATLTACRSYFQRLVLPHRPDTLIFYAGDNDIGSGRKSEDVAQEFDLFRAQVAQFLPDAQCFVVSIKPSPFRVQFQPQIQAANAAIRQMVVDDPKWTYVDFHSPMLDAKGHPSEAFYGADPLHVNVAGYGLLGKVLRDAMAD